MRKIFKYFEPVWCGEDNKPSIKRLLAISFSAHLIYMIQYVITKWDATRAPDGVVMILGIEAALITAFLGMQTYSNIKHLDAYTQTEDPNLKPPKSE